MNLFNLYYGNSHSSIFTAMGTQPDLSQISDGLCMMLNEIIGDDIAIAVRRTYSNVQEEFQALNNDHVIWCYSGSKAEGFQFKTSDDDWMCVYRDVKVISDISHANTYNNNITLLLMDNAMNKPGFTLLKPLSQPKHFHVCLSTMHNAFLNEQFVSSQRWREIPTNAVNRNNSNVYSTHGPCTSGLFLGTEFDIAYCVKSDVWPQMAYDCIRRLHQSQWPSTDVIHNIIRDGIVFVAIGAKQSCFEDIEWRISFSLAEKRLIHAMNHSQFRCYGLLKIFLKEAIEVKEGLNGLLCSYFLKTSVFWEITSSSIPWTASTLLIQFWHCFQRLLHWISNGYCPNFFIPENNMFAGKIEGENSRILLDALNELYREGYKCLMRCPSLKLRMQRLIEIPGIASSYKRFIASLNRNALIAVAIISKIRYFRSAEVLPLNGEVHLNNRIRWLEQLAASKSDALSGFFFRIMLSRFLDTFAKLNIGKSILGNTNKLYYNFTTHNMNLADHCRIDANSHHFYRAIWLYNMERYETVLKIMERAERKIDNPLSMKGKTNDFAYSAAGGDHLPILTVMRSHFCEVVFLRHGMIIRELAIEIDMHPLRNIGSSLLVVSPKLFALLFKFLCYDKLKFTERREEVLTALSSIVRASCERDIPLSCKAISWEILGICQQMYGDYWEACDSYIMALRQNFSQCANTLQKATCVRLCTILVKFFT